MVQRRRRAMLLGAAAAVGVPALTAIGASTNDQTETIYGGTMGLSDAYNVAGKLWIGPDSAKSTVSADKGRVYMATDSQVDYYGDGSSWTMLGIGSDSKAIPEAHSDLVETQQVLVEDTA